jgi:hypothetical protein
MFNKFIPVLFVAAACGGGSGDDDIEIVDSNANCTAPNSFGVVTPGTQNAFSDMMAPATTPEFFQFEADLDGAASPDVMLVQLFKGFGVFTPDFPAPAALPLTIQITGDEAQFSSCGACILVIGDVGADGMATGDPYLATSGSLTLTTLSSTMMEGSVSNLVLTRVTIDEDTDVSTPSADGCTSSVDSMAFSSAVMPR